MTCDVCGTYLLLEVGRDAVRHDVLAVRGVGVQALAQRCGAGGADARLHAVQRPQHRVEARAHHVH